MAASILEWATDLIQSLSDTFEDFEHEHARICNVQRFPAWGRWKLTESGEIRPGKVVYFLIAKHLRLYAVDENMFSCFNLIEPCSYANLSRVLFCPLEVSECVE